MGKVNDNSTTDTIQDKSLVLTPLQPQTILLNDEETIATLYPIPCDSSLFPHGLLSFILDEFNMEISKGVSFPYYESLTKEEFEDIWFHRDGHLCIMVLGEIPELDYGAVTGKTDLRNNYGTLIETQRHTTAYVARKKKKKLNLNIQWEKQCLGVFSLHPAYPGRSAHISTGTFLVNAGIRGKGIGKALADTFLEWAKGLGFTSAYFPLVYGTNVGMRCILEELNFRRVGMLPSSAILKGFDIPIDSFIYEKELTSISKSMDVFKYHDKSDFIGKYERMLYYMTHKKYPKDCNKSEKARIRMQSKHHTLKNGKLLFKEKEVVYDPVKQNQLVLEEHLVEHGGINKVSNKISKKYHWNGIKTTVTEVLSQCSRCKSRYSDDTGVIVTSDNNNVKQAHMIPNTSNTTITNNNNNSKRSQNTVSLRNRGREEYQDKLAHLAEVIERASNVEQQIDISQTQDISSQYDGPTPNDKVELLPQNNKNNNLVNPTPPDATTIKGIQNHNNKRKRTYESALQHGLLSSRQSSDNNNDNNFNMNDTIDMSMRSLNKIVEEEDRKKRRRMVESDPDESTDAVYAFNRVNSSSRLNSPQKGDPNGNRSSNNNNNNNNINNNNNNNNNNFNLDPAVMEALNIPPGNNNNGSDRGNNNSTNIPLQWGFDEDYLEEEDEDYQDPTSAIDKEEVDDEEEEEDEDEDEHAGGMETDSIQLELESLQQPLPDDSLSYDYLLNRGI